MNATTDLNNVGPIELIYHWTDQIFQGAQGLLAAEKISDFFETVKWNEPFIRALLTMQFAIFAITFITRRNDFIQFGILVLITASTLAAERLNAFGSKYWSRFATQNYFDGPGLFMMVFVSGPFVILANFIVVCDGNE